MTRSKAYNSLTFATIIFSSISFSIAFHSWKLSPFKKEQSISLYSSVTPERVEHIAVGRASSSLDLDYTFHTVINKEARSASGIYNSKFSDRDRHSARLVIRSCSPAGGSTFSSKPCTYKWVTLIFSSFF